MLTVEEKGFIEYWEKNRLKRKRVFRQLAVGLPLGTALAFFIFVNLVSGWYKRVDMMIHADASLILVVLIALVLIVIFIVIFSARHSWDQNEQRYRELLARNDAP